MGWDGDLAEVFLSETRFAWDLREAYELSENRFGHLTSRARKSDLHDFPNCQTSWLVMVFRDENKESFGGLMTPFWVA